MNKLIIITVLFSLALTAMADCPYSGACDSSLPVCVISRSNSTDKSDSGVFPRRTNLYFPPATKTYTDRVVFPMPTFGEVMILQDIGEGVDSDDMKSVANTIHTVQNFFQQEMPDLRFAFATFDESLGSYTPRTVFSADTAPKGYLATTIDNFASSFPRNVRLSDTPNNGAVLDAVIDAAKDANVGWSKYSAKFIVVLTRWGYPTSSPFMSQDTFRSELLKYGALPIFCTQTLSSTAGKAQFQALVDAIQIGVVGSGNTKAHNALNQDQGNWNQLAKFGISDLRAGYFGQDGSLGPIQWVATQGAQYVQSVTFSTGVNQIIADIVYIWTNPSHTVSPYVVINFVGYGEVIATFKTNTPPSLSSDSYTLAQDSDVDWSLVGVDTDGQPLSLTFNPAPTAGQGAFGTVSNSALGSTSSLFSSTYTPNRSYAGTFTVPASVFDGCAYGTGSLTFTVTQVVVPPTPENTPTPTNPPVAAPVAPPVPPTSNDEVVTTKQNTPVSITLDGVGPNTPIVAVINIPAGFKGTLYSDSERTTAIQNGHVATGTRTLYYLPPLDETGEPFTQFFFKVRDSANLVSARTYIVTINVIPVYGGSKTVNIYEDTVGYINLKPTDSLASSDNNPLVATLTALNDGAGTFYLCSEVSSCSSALSSAPVNVPAGTQFVKFVPAADDFASPYATFSYRLDDTGSAHNVNGVYDVTINVLPVNDPPTITPGFQERESTPADTPLKLTYTGADKDDAVETLISIVTYLPQRGSLYRSDNGARGTIITESDNVVQATTPGNFEVFFVPTPGSSGRNYATIAFAVQDPHGARSSNAFVTINVTPVNRPPNVVVGGPYRVVVGDTLPIAETSVNDPDVGNFNMKVTLALAQGSTGTFTLTDSRAAQACSSNADNVLTCVAPENKLNSFLASLTFQSDVVGLHHIDVTVDDLNNGATADLRGTPGLTDSDKIEITVVPPSEVVTDENNQDLTIALSVSGAGALAALGIGGFFLGRKLKKAAPADDYFSFMNDDNTDVKINPLFASKYGGPADNPVYTANV